MTHEPEPAAPNLQEEDPTMTSGLLSPEELAAVRDLALRAYPETVPELVGGEDLASILRSVERASLAYQRIAEATAARTPSPAPVPTVPAGATPPVAIDPDRLPPVEKIRRALATRR